MTVLESRERREPEGAHNNSFSFRDSTNVNLQTKTFVP